MAAGGLGLWLSCSPSGLLCSWLVFDADLDFDRGSNRFRIASDNALVTVCELPTGRIVSVARLHSVAVDCHPAELCSTGLPSGPGGGEDRAGCSGHLMASAFCCVTPAWHQAIQARLSKPACEAADVLTSSGLDSLAGRDTLLANLPRAGPGRQV